MRWVGAAVMWAACLTMAPPARADEACLGPIARAPDGTRIERAALGTGEVRITYIGHATFTIESPKGIIGATDYNDYVRPVTPPDIATMNHAHSTHFTYRPDPAIRHVLRGWMSEGKPPRHDILEGDLRVRNVPTNIRAGWGEGGTEFSGNSIFIFEVAGLCIAHLGHLHHTLTPEHLAAIGQVDIVFAAIDGSWTIELSGIREVIGQLKPKIVVPMHYFSQRVLENFLSTMRESHDIERLDSASMIVSRAFLPTKPAIKVLIGR